MSFSSTRPLLPRTAVSLAAAIATIALLTAPAVGRGGGGGGGGSHGASTGGGGGGSHSTGAGGAHPAASVFRPGLQVSRPQGQFNRTVNQHSNRHTQGFTQSNSGRHSTRCHNCGGHQQNNPTPAKLNNPTNQQGHLPQTVSTTRPLNAQVLKQGPGKPITFKPASLKPTFPVVSMHSKVWPVLKGQKFIWLGGNRHFFIPVGLLGVALIGGSYWYPDGYVSIAGPLCIGFTPDGCQLEWRTVDFEDGGYATQCVQYCPQAGPPPARVVTLPPKPALAMNGNCQLTIYENPGFTGLSAPTSDNQPLLSEAGWKDEISSIQVESGTWDFFNDENFGGDSIRMSSGSYPTLVAEWNKRIGSFMCVEPGGSGT